MTSTPPRETKIQNSPVERISSVKTFQTRAVESEFKSNPIFPIFSAFPISSDFLSDFIRFLDFFRLLDLPIPQL